MAAIQKCGSNLSKTHPILLIWLPLTTTYSQKLKQKELSGDHFATDDDVMDAVNLLLAPSTHKGSICSMTAGLIMLM